MATRSIRLAKPAGWSLAYFVAIRFTQAPVFCRLRKCFVELIVEGAVRDNEKVGVSKSPSSRWGETYWYRNLTDRLTGCCCTCIRTTEAAKAHGIPNSGGFLGQRQLDWYHRIPKAISHRNNLTIPSGDRSGDKQVTPLLSRSESG
jgi:hypothetical protein